MKEASEIIKYSVDCIDGTTIEFSSLDDLLKFPNRKEKQYNKIEIRNPYTDDINISVRFSSREYSSISYRISADERIVDYYSGKIEGLLMSTKQWYGFFHNSFFGFLFSIGLTCIIVYLLALYGFLTENLFFIAMVTIGVLLFFLYDKINKILFPVASFELGDGIDRVKRNASIRNIVLVSVFLSILISYGVNQLPNLWD